MLPTATATATAEGEDEQLPQQQSNQSHQSTSNKRALPASTNEQEEDETKQQALVGERTLIAHQQKKAKLHPEMNNDNNNETDKKEKAKAAMDPPLPPSTISHLALEAIFHPKFENEQRNNQDDDESAIRAQMKQRVLLSSSSSSSSDAGGGGYLEVSLKHSGSLLLWSGGERYYSKNSTDNVFTRVGEMLLRQHFFRASFSNNNDSNKYDEAAYQRCSAYIQQHELTCAFEVVTDCLGDHGDRPLRDFLILTAVANRQTEQFFNTAELLELACQFGLPYNDAWIFSTPAAVDQLFGWYDDIRETGTAATVVSTLNRMADHQVVSMYPHDIFQGDILEGIVIRFVSDNNNHNSNSLLARMQALSQRSREWLQQAPPDLGPCHRLVQTKLTKEQRQHVPPVLSTDLRTVLTDSSSINPKKDNENKEDDAAGTTATTEVTNTSAMQLDEPLRQILHASGSTRQTRRLAKRDVDVAAWTKGLLDQNKNHAAMNDTARDETTRTTTRRIAQLIQTLSSFSDPVDFNLVREETTTTTNSTNDGATTTTPATVRVRWLCIVHVMLDKTFPKYRHNAPDGSMELFRGFVLELNPEKQQPKDDDDTTSHDDNLKKIASRTPEQQQQQPPPPLMLKMKFLPYMVRTFGCRNGLPRIRKGGPGAFSRYTAELMTKWGISPAGRAQWQPFFDAWGEYVQDVWNNPHTDNSDNNDNSSPPAQPEEEEAATATAERPKVPLTGFNYLMHLEYFEKLFKLGQLSATQYQTESSRLQGIVIVAAPTKETVTLVADFVAQQLGGARRIHGAVKLTRAVAEESCAPGRGHVCSVVATEEAVGPVKRLFKDYSDFLSLINFQLSDDDLLAATSLLPETCQKKMRGMAKSWTKLRVQRTFPLPFDSLFQASPPTKDGIHPSNEFQSVITSLSNLQSKDERPGLLVFFPQIPGCGKSCLAGKTTQDEIQKGLAVKTTNNEDHHQKRNLIVMAGDKTRGKYWNAVKQCRRRDPPSVFVADKNAPILSLDAVGNACGHTKGYGVAVIPDELALQTTEVNGVGPFGKVERIVERKHTYPFSLTYLAVCMARVLERPAGTHDGKLDQGTRRACLIVIKFFALYRNISAEAFVGEIDSQFAKCGAVTVSPIKVPFFKTPCGGTLPPALEQVLLEALRVHYACDQQKGDSTSDKNSEENNEQLDDLEARLRAAVDEHKDFLLGLACDEVASRGRFVSQLLERVAECDALTEYKGERQPFIKLVSIDVNRQEIHDLLLNQKGNSELQAFFDMMLEDRSVDEVLIGTNNNNQGGSNKPTDKRLVTDTHVTLAHFRHRSQSALRQTYSPLVGSRVQLWATGLLWGPQTAALAVTVEPQSVCGKDVPASANDFVHITLFVQNGASAMESNELPKLVQSGTARRYDFETPVPLEGTISLWKT